MPSEEMAAFIEMLRAQRAETVGVPRTIDETRAAFVESLAALPPTPGGTVEAVDAGGVPAEWTRLDGQPDHTGTLLYLHGGGYTQGSPVTHRRLVTALAVAAGVRSLSVDYRLAPENPHPAAVDDALTAYDWLTGPGGEQPDRIIVAGDSAGGGLSAALLVALRDAKKPLPAGAYLISPWTDLAGTGESVTTRRDAEPLLDPDALLDTARMYLPEGDLTQPLVSPLYADLQGLPPLLVHVGDLEILLDDSTRLVERARTAGVPVDFEAWADAFHVFQMLVGLVPEADEAVAQAGAWMAKRLAEAA